MIFISSLEPLPLHAAHSCILQVIYLIVFKSQSIQVIHHSNDNKCTLVCVRDTFIACSWMTFIYSEMKIKPCSSVTVSCKSPFVLYRPALLLLFHTHIIIINLTLYSKQKKLQYDANILGTFSFNCNKQELSDSQTLKLLKNNTSIITLKLKSLELQLHRAFKLLLACCFGFLVHKLSSHPPCFQQQQSLHTSCPGPNSRQTNSKTTCWWM